MDPYARHAVLLGQVQRYLGKGCPEFTWPATGGKCYKTLPGGATRRKDLGAGGFQMSADLTLVVVLAQFAGRVPAPQQQLVYLGDLYRIDAITKLQGNRVWRLECMDASQGVG